jgi:hypothetical protein
MQEEMSAAGREENQRDELRSTTRTSWKVVRGHRPHAEVMRRASNTRAREDQGARPAVGVLTV